MSAACWVRFCGALSVLFPLLAVAATAEAQLYSAAAAAPAKPAGAIPAGVDPAQIEAAQAVMQAMMKGKQGGPGKPGKGKEGPGGPAQPGKADDAKSKESNEPVHRPPAPSQSPNRDEFKIRPDASGKVRLNFNNQPWQPVLEWVATISGMSLDWQDLPGDSLNLTTRRSYTVPEVRDLINQHLLARGYTMLCHGEVLSVADIKKLDPSLVPRIEPADLAKRDPHEFVKVSFPLEMFSAEAATSELKPLLSPNGKLFAMNETSRLEAMDAVLNLRDVDAVLRQQQASASQPKTFRTFKLKYARAEEVHKTLVTLLGPQSHGMPGMPPGMNPEQAAMMMQQQQQQGGGRPGQPQPNAAAKDTVTMAVDERNNAVLVHAKPDKMAVIAQWIEAVDIPPDRNSLSAVNMGRMQIYRLSGIDPEPVVKTLMDVGNLDPSTRLEVDRKNSAIVAYAPLADHVTIRALVDKLTGTDRKFEVIRLHRLAADYVAGTIAVMLGGGAKKEQRRPWYFGDSSQDDKKSGEFHVEADVEHNRLLLLANPVELGEVEGLLVKLGEIPAAGSGSTTRVIESGDPQETQELLKRIESIWPSVAPNALQTPGGAVDGKAPVKPGAGVGPVTKAPEAKSGAAARLADKSAQSPAALPREPIGDSHSSTIRYTDVRGAPALPPLGDRIQPGHVAESTRSPRDPRAGGPPPVKIAIGPDGKLVISSEDSQALDLLEQLVAEMPATHKDYRIFHLKYVSSVTVAMNLEDFFKEKKESNRDMPWWYMYEYGSQDNNDQDERRLSKRPKLKFISDVDSNTVLVEGADPRQMKTIEELIQVYDQPPPTDSQSVRKTELIHLKYSKAKVVADTIKDVYRDLLSANDKALENNQNGPRTVFNFGSDTDSSGQKVPHFKGLLSIGVDETSNSVMVSAPAFLFDHVERMVHDLDKAAAPEYEVRVLRIGPDISSERVKDILDQVYDVKTSKEPAEKPAEEKPGTNKPGNHTRNGSGNKPQQQ